MNPVILAGGKGQRFWPLSRRQNPKQFLSLDGSGKSLLQTTAERLLPAAEGWERLWAITVANQEKRVRQQLPDLPETNLLVQPEDRETAPAIAWATLEINRQYGEDAIIGVFPADHWIGDEEVFQQTLKVAEVAAYQSEIVTLGIPPTYPSTAYGYIQQGKEISRKDDVPIDIPIYKVERFIEKPDLPKAEKLLADGRFSWDSGILIFQAKTMLEELHTYMPEIIGPLKAQGLSAYPNLPPRSIYFDLMEKTQKAYLLPTTFGWDDLGDWNALERLFKGEKSNVELAKHVGIDTQGTILYATDKQDVIVTIGLQDVVIVRYGNVTLVVDKNRTQEIKQVLKLLQADSKLKDLL
ncbi:MAG: mannose-1-phosphate guanylyltransferase [Calothrix sp. MO_167.B42]|nr:mannose-1-phosphate guanylyltransferase [Calothrix sp. MO_167.B42]